MTAQSNARVPRNDLLNRSYVVVLYALLGMGGSLFSVFVIGALAYSAVKRAMGRLASDRAHIGRSMTVAGSAYYASGALMALADPQAANLSLLLERLPFVLFLPLFLQLRWTDGQAIRKSLETGALVGAIGLAAWIAGEVLLFSSDFSAFRAIGPPGNSGPLATSAAFLFTVNLFAITNGEVYRRILAGLAAFVCAAIVGLSGMRTLLPVLVIVPLIFFVLFPDMRRAALRPVGLAATAVAAVLLILITGALLKARIGLLIGYVAEEGLQPSAEDSLGQRIALWMCSSEAFGDAPVFGLGRAGALEFMQSCTMQLTGTAISYSHFHNAAFNALAIGGLVELAATIALLAVPLYWAWYFRAVADARYGIALVAALSAIFMMNGMFNIMLDHDIHDALFIHATTIALVIMADSGADPAQAGKP